MVIENETPVDDVINRSPSLKAAGPGSFHRTFLKEMLTRTSNVDLDHAIETPAVVDMKPEHPQADLVTNTNLETVVIESYETSIQLEKHFANAVNEVDKIWCHGKLPSLDGSSRRHHDYRDDFYIRTGTTFVRNMGEYDRIKVEGVINWAPNSGIAYYSPSDLGYLSGSSVIESLPMEPDNLIIRVVGQSTNKLYTYIQTVFSMQQNPVDHRGNGQPQHMVLKLPTARLDEYLIPVMLKPEIFSSQFKILSPNSSLQNRVAIKNAYILQQSGLSNPSVIALVNHMENAKRITNRVLVDATKLRYLLDKSQFENLEKNIEPGCLENRQILKF